MSDAEIIDLLADIRRHVNGLMTEIFRLEALVKQLDILAIQVSARKVDMKLLEKFGGVGQPEPVRQFQLPPRDCNGSTTAADAVRLVLSDMPDVFHLRDLTAAVRARFPHVNTTPNQFSATWSYVRKRDQSIERLNGGNCYRKGKGIKA